MRATLFDSEHKTGGAGSIEPLPRLVVEATRSQLIEYQWLWMKYVRGFAQANHCAASLLGTWSKTVRPLQRGAIPAAATLSETAQPYDFIYLCGVSNRTWARNFHLVGYPAAGKLAIGKMASGAVFRLENVEAVSIPALKPGWNGLPRSHWACRNFQFGVANYGYQIGSEKVYK